MNRSLQICSLAAAVTVFGLSHLHSQPALKWSPLPPLPDAEGFAGAFAGVCEGRLVAAGGTNFPDKKPWEGGEKKWYDTVFVLDGPEGKWRTVGRLPQANGYGVSLTTPEGLVCVGGGNAAENFRSVFRLRLAGDRVRIEELPALPVACAFMAGAQLGSVVYIAGGI
jgi:N-acetylneuraminate epimerase